MNREFRGVVLSDIHLGNNRNKTRDIVKNMTLELARHTDVDIIVIAGDLYDRILSLGSDEAIVSISFMTWLADHCSTHSIVLRLLEGTPSHDFGQGAVFQELLSENPLLDFRYISDIEVEILPDSGISILYVPDEARHTVEEAMVDIHKARNGEDVDIAIMHGQFHYQLPFELASSYNEDEFDFVRYFIFIGHVHNHNPKGKIIPQGSFDRLSHGEDSPKGYVRFRINPNTGGSYQFIENKRAKKFDTITISTDDMVRASKQLSDKLDKYDSDYLRVDIQSDLIDATVLMDISRKRGVTLTIKDKKKDVNQEENIETISSTQFSITSDNLEELLMSRLNVTADMESIVLTELRNIK